MDPKQRLHLDFGGDFGNQRRYEPTNNRVFPTTPSTFPQPVPGNQQRPVANNAYGQPSPNPYAPSGGAGYFAQAQMPTDNRVNQYGQQQQQPQYQQYSQQHIAPPQPAYQQRQGGYNQQNQNHVDPTSNLAYQFSNQNLGAAPRQGSPYGRQPSPGPRLYTNQQQQQPQQRSNQAYDGGQRTPPGLMSHSAQSQSTQAPGERSASPAVATQSVEDAPEKNPELYPSNIIKRGQGMRSFVEAFFKENINRARDRNVRARELDEFLKNPSISDDQKVKQKDRVQRAEAQFLRLLRTSESVRNFMTIKVIGKGAFGEVKLVQRKTNGMIFALKSLIKTEMFKKEQLAHVRAERDILAESDSPWVVKLFLTWQDPAYLHMLMEFLPGGDLMTMLIKYEIFSIPITRFYMAELLLAIESVHKHGYIHRDIKPDNILLDRDGHVKLTDFGLSTGFHKQHDNSYYQELMHKNISDKKKRENRQSVSLDQINLTISNRSQVNTWRKSRRVLAYSTVGTPDYIAPEIFGGQGYSFGCDWWSVGAIMFECLVGWPPFCAEDAHDTYRKIVNWRQHLQFPDDVNAVGEHAGSHEWPDAENCIRSLLCDVGDRLGAQSGPNGGSEIKAHPFFRGVHWDQLRGIRAPFKPDLRSNVDYAYFPTDEIDQSDHSQHHRAAIDAMPEGAEAELNLPFIGYTYKRFDSYRSS